MLPPGLPECPGRSVSQAKNLAEQGRASGAGQGRLGDLSGHKSHKETAAFFDPGLRLRKCRREQTAAEPGGQDGLAPTQTSSPCLLNFAYASRHANLLICRLGFFADVQACCFHDSLLVTFLQQSLRVLAHDTIHSRLASLQNSTQGQQNWSPFQQASRSSNLASGGAGEQNSLPESTNTLATMSLRQGQ